MNRESTLLVGLWDVVGDHISKAQRVDAVISILRLFEDFGMELEDFEDAIDEDPYIKNGYESIVEPEDDYKDEEYEE